jgi:hypothetical protein
MALSIMSKSILIGGLALLLVGSGAFLGSHFSDVAYRSKEQAFNVLIKQKDAQIAENAQKVVVAEQTAAVEHGQKLQL